MRNGLIAGAAALMFAATAAYAVDAGRYAPPSGEFSIAMQTAPDLTFKVDSVQSNDSFTYVNMKFVPGVPMKGGYAERTIYWTPKVVPPVGSALDVAATDFVTGYLDDRFPRGKFEITTRSRGRTATGEAYFVFGAKGTHKEVPAMWQGVVFFYLGKASVVVSEVYTLNAKPIRDAAGVTDAGMLAWATSIKPEK